LQIVAQLSGSRLAPPTSRPSTPGAASSASAILVIDAKEGVRENSRRHGYLLSMLGIGQVAVCVNKMDLVDYAEKVFDGVQREFTAFLERVGIRPAAFIPIAAREGVPPYIIFADSTLKEMTSRLPASSDAMLAVKGVGEAKLARYGREFLEVIASYRNERSSE
jgi:superfamily II DNA helicase RecQ